MKQVHGDIFAAITQISVSQKMAINVVGSGNPLSLIHEACISFRKYKSEFPLVIVQLQHGEPGNMHPCNSDAQIT